MRAMDEIPWPKKGDKLFHGGTGHWSACLNWLSLIDNWHLYSEGYKLAGDVLVQHVANTNSEHDLLVYPIIFNYRQYLELRLKEIIQNGNDLLDIKGGFPKTHDIGILWAGTREILERIWPNGPAEDLDTVEVCIAQFSSTDPSSMAFRYPEDRDGNPSLPGQRHIDLINFAEVMDGIAGLLSGVCDAISEYLDNKRDMESWLREYDP